MPEIKDWPIATLTPRGITLQLEHRSRSGGVALNGMEQVISPLSAVWRLSIDLNVVRDWPVRTYRAFLASLKGRFNYVRMPICDAFGARVLYEQEFFTDSTGFSDATGHGTTTLNTTVTTAAALRGAEEIRLNIEGLGGALGVGHYFSVNDYFHVLTEPVSETATELRAKIAPPLREDVALGATVKLGRPTMLVRLTDDMAGPLHLQMGRWGSPSLDFIEVLTR